MFEKLLIEERKFRGKKKSFAKRMIIVKKWILFKEFKNTGEKIKDLKEIYYVYAREYLQET